MGSNAARSVPIISWHQPAQRHLVPDLGAAAALPHEKKVGLGLISRSILLLTVCMVLYSKVSVHVCQCLSAPLRWLIYITEKKCDCIYITCVGDSERCRVSW